MVQCLQDFFLDVNVFVAYGSERQTLDDYELSSNEIRFVSAYKSVRQTERITLRSPKVQRKYSFNPSLVNGDAGRRYGARGMTPVSPSAGRKKRDLNPRAKSAPGWKNGTDATSNGHSGLHIAPAPSKLTAKYRVGKTIGQGNFAVVKDCVDKQTKERFALKIISKSLCRGREQMIHTEVSILRCLKHSNIVQLMEDFETADELFLVMELVTGGDLFDAIASASSYTERDASGMLYNLASAVSHLHSLHIVHRDIKPENILVCEHSDGTKSLKLGDFGLAVEVRTPLLTVCGTPTYVAPEILAETGPPTLFIQHWPHDKEVLGVNHRPTAFQHWPHDKEILGVNHRPTAYQHWPHDKEILSVNHRPTAYRHWPHDKEILGVNHRRIAYQHWPHDKEILDVNHRPTAYRHWPHDKEVLGVNHRPTAYQHWPHDKEILGVNHRPTAYWYWPHDKEVLCVNHRPTAYQHWPHDKEVLGVNHRPTAYQHWPHDKEILGVNHRPTAYRHWPHDKEVLGVNHRPTAYRHWPHDKEVLGVNHRPTAYRHWPHDKEVLGVNHRPAAYRH
ncbi:Serine/threonine-protein kinase DCLK1 [Lamellibrachia satsuma]|nr:Serine/threonine-protein kinase DCLK1 [Lamellibrachia satsuma]